MLLIDKVLLFPINATVWVARQVLDAANQELQGEPERITAALSELYMMLETGRISESEFTAREKELLDRLDQIEQQSSGRSEAGQDSAEAELEPRDANPVKVQK